MRNSERDSGVGIFTVLLIVFIVLKLTGNISWPWPIVLIPLWIQLAALAILLIVFVIDDIWEE